MKDSDPNLLNERIRQKNIIREIFNLYPNKPKKLKQGEKHLTPNASPLRYSLATEQMEEQELPSNILSKSIYNPAAYYASSGNTANTDINGNQLQNLRNLDIENMPREIFIEEGDSIDAGLFALLMSQRLEEQKMNAKLNHDKSFNVTKQRFHENGKLSQEMQSEEKKPQKSLRVSTLKQKSEIKDEPFGVANEIENNTPLLSKDSKQKIKAKKVSSMETLPQEEGEENWKAVYNKDRSKSNNLGMASKLKLLGICTQKDTCSSQNNSHLDQGNLANCTTKETNHPDHSHSHKDISAKANLEELISKDIFPNKVKSSAPSALIAGINSIQGGMRLQQKNNNQCSAVLIPTQESSKISTNQFKLELMSTKPFAIPLLELEAQQKTGNEESHNRSPENVSPINRRSSSLPRLLQNQLQQQGLAHLQLHNQNYQQYQSSNNNSNQNQGTNEVAEAFSPYYKRRPLYKNTENIQINRKPQEQQSQQFSEIASQKQKLNGNQQSYQIDIHYIKQQYQNQHSQQTQDHPQVIPNKNSATNNCNNNTNNNNYNNIQNFNNNNNNYQNKNNNNNGVEDNNVYSNQRDSPNLIQQLDDCEKSNQISNKGYALLNDVTTSKNTQNIFSIYSNHIKQILEENYCQKKTIKNSSNNESTTTHLQTDKSQIQDTNASKPTHKINLSNISSATNRVFVNQKQNLQSPSIVIHTGSSGANQNNNLPNEQQQVQSNSFKIQKQQTSGNRQKTMNQISLFSSMQNIEANSNNKGELISNSNRLKDQSSYSNFLSNHNLQGPSPLTKVLFSGVTRQQQYQSSAETKNPFGSSTSSGGGNNYCSNFSQKLNELLIKSDIAQNPSFLSQNPSQISQNPSQIFANKSISSPTPPLPPFSLEKENFTSAAAQQENSYKSKSPLHQTKSSKLFQQNGIMAAISNADLVPFISKQVQEFSKILERNKGNFYEKKESQNELKSSSRFQQGGESSFQKSYIHQRNASMPKLLPYVGNYENSAASTAGQHTTFSSISQINNNYQTNNNVNSNNNNNNNYVNFEENQIFQPKQSKRVMSTHMLESNGQPSHLISSFSNLQSPNIMNKNGSNKFNSCVGSISELNENILQNDSSTSYFRQLLHLQSSTNNSRQSPSMRQNRVLNKEGGNSAIHLEEQSSNLMAANTNNNNNNIVNTEYQQSRNQNMNKRVQRSQQRFYSLVVQEKQKGGQQNLEIEDKSDNIKLVTQQQEKLKIQQYADKIQDVIMQQKKNYMMQKKHIFS